MSKGDPLRPQTYERAVLEIGCVGGFAPGGYISICRQCGVHFDGDKRAITCLPCAVADLRTLATAQSPRPGEEALRAALVELKKQIMNYASGCLPTALVGAICQAENALASLPPVLVGGGEALSSLPVEGGGNKDHSSVGSQADPSRGLDLADREPAFEGWCVKCGGFLERGPTGRVDCPACNPARPS